MSGLTISDAVVRVDGGDYRGCVFMRCVISWNGGPFVMIGNRLVNCTCLVYGNEVENGEFFPLVNGAVS